jgi:hypothetical protein
VDGIQQRESFLQHRALVRQTALLQLLSMNFFALKFVRPPYVTGEPGEGTGGQAVRKTAGAAME